MPRFRRRRYRLTPEEEELLDTIRFRSEESYDIPPPNLIYDDALNAFITPYENQLYDNMATVFDLQDNPPTAVMRQLENDINFGMENGLLSNNFLEPTSFYAPMNRFMNAYLRNPQLRNEFIFSAQTLPTTTEFTDAQNELIEAIQSHTTEETEKMIENLINETPPAE